MNVRTCFNVITTTSGLPKVKISESLGKRRNYVNTIMAKATVPQTDTFAKVADVCGWDLLARNRTTGEEIIIDPE